MTSTFLAQITTAAEAADTIGGPGVVLALIAAVVLLLVRSVQRQIAETSQQFSRAMTEFLELMRTARAALTAGFVTVLIFGMIGLVVYVMNA